MLVGLPCWLLLQRHRWGPWYWSAAYRQQYHLCAGCGRLCWRSMTQGDLSHPVYLARTDDHAPWTGTTPRAAAE